MCVALHRQPTAKVDPWRELIEVQSKTFDQLLDESAGGSALSLEVKKAEMATTDLATLVRHSNLKARDMLASSLKEFVDDARKTGRGLQKMSAKVGGAVDKWAISTLGQTTLLTVLQHSGSQHVREAHNRRGQREEAFHFFQPFSVV